MKICTYLMFSIALGLGILIFPYILTLSSFFNKDRVLAWRKFFIIISVCCLPFPLIFAGLYRYSYSYATEFGFFFRLASSYYAIYLVLGCIIKKRTNLQVSWWKFIVLSTAYYLIVSNVITLDVFNFCNDPLIECTKDVLR